MKFSFDWFKSQKQKEIERLMEERDLLLLEKVRIQSLEKKASEKASDKKPYVKLKLVNDVITIVLESGEVLSRKNSTIEDFESIRKLSTIDGIIDYFKKSNKGNEESLPEDIEDFLNNVTGHHMDMLVQTGDFNIKGNSIYINDINRSLPPLLVSRFYDLVQLDNYTENEEYIGLKRFFMWCCLNPRPEVADRLYDFLMKNKMKITKQGFFVALRNVVNVKGKDSEIVEFVSNTYNKIKGVWKKNPGDYEVFDDNGYTFVHRDKQNHGYNKHVGNLKDLYMNLPEMRENRFTDNWSKSFDIRIGRPVSMNIDECNWSTQDCAAAGLHFAGHTNPYILCGDTTVFVLINPMKVVGIGEEKGRCYEYFPFMVCPFSEADEIMRSREFDFLQMDEMYVVDQLEDLEETAKKGFIAESKKYEFNFSGMSSSEMRSIINQLNNMRQEISNRVTPLE